jgi:hypothetical protein
MIAHDEQRNKEKTRHLKFGNGKAESTAADELNNFLRNERGDDWHISKAASFEY